MVYYVHSNTRCPTCRAIELQARETVQTDFAAQLERGVIVWKTINYEESATSELAAKFEIQMPVVVLARKKDGQIEDWNRLDKVWGLVGDKPAFAEYLRHEIHEMLDASDQDPLGTQPAKDQALPVPGSETDDLPVPTLPVEIPIPE